MDERGNTGCNRGYNAKVLGYHRGVKVEETGTFLWCRV